MSNPCPNENHCTDREHCEWHGCKRFEEPAPREAGSAYEAWLEERAEKRGGAK